MNEAIPKTQCAVQLTGPSTLALNPAKPLPQPQDRQILMRIEATGLCFSDLKLLKQFADHPRKGHVVSGVSQDVLDDLPSYVPGEKPTVPGHECVGVVVAVGENVQRIRPGQRFILQPDWRQVMTEGTNAAFGYNFEGALAQYTLLDEQIVCPSPEETYLLEAGEGSASALGMVEPWGCVEFSYAAPQRQEPLDGGAMLVVVEDGHDAETLADCLPKTSRQRIAITANEQQAETLRAMGFEVTSLAGDLAEAVPPLENEAWDDVLLFGSSPEIIEALSEKLARGGIANIVLGGRDIGRDVSIGVGKIHYGPTRWVGTVGNDPADGYAMLPANGELHPSDAVGIIGAGGPMGQMHTIRAICCGLEGVTVTATDIDDDRLAQLARKVEPLARQRAVDLRCVNTARSPLDSGLDYYAMMVPSPQLLAEAVTQARPGAIINVFAGIAAPTRHPMDLQRIIRERIFVYGTSGSRIEDMVAVRDKVHAGDLDTNCCVDAVSGMAGAVDGIAAVENRTLAGKIVVYPALRDLPLLPLTRLADVYPSVAETMSDGLWSADAEAELLRVAQSGETQ